MATITRGIDIKVKVNTGDAITPVMTVVGFQRGGTLNRESETIDITNKDDFGWASFVQGAKSWSVDADGLYATDDVGLEFLETAFLNGTEVELEIAFGTTVFEGKAVITSFPVEIPYDDVATYSLTFSGKGALTRTAA